MPMEQVPYDPWPQTSNRRSRAATFLGVLVAILMVVGVLVAVLFPPIEGVKSGVPVSRKMSTLNYPASLVQNIGQPIGGTWLLPTSVAGIENTLFVLDTGNNRILVVDSEGELVSTLGSAEGIDLQQPMSITTDGDSLYVANSLVGEVMKLSPAGKVEDRFVLEKMAGDAKPRPIGVAVNHSGKIVVSDAENHRVLILDSEGHQSGSFGTGTRAGGSQGLNVPGALYVDDSDNIYVVDTLNGRIVELSPEGEFIRDFAGLADTAGSLARPKGVAVDGAGRIFVTDGLQAAIEVFGPDGGYLGVIGRRNPDDPAAGSIFEAPSGLLLTEDRMYVVDGVLGLLVLRLPGSMSSVSEAIE